MEDSKKVQSLLDNLNKDRPTKPWIEVKGVNIMPLLTVDNFGNFKVNPNTGYPVKLFIDSSTGEVKVYSQVRVQRD